MFRTVLFTLVLPLRLGMNPRNGMIIPHPCLTIRDYVKPYSTQIVLECLLLVKIFPLDDHRAAVRSHPLNKIRRSNLSEVHQFISAQIQIFIRHGYKSIIIALTPINGSVTLNLKLLMPLKLSPRPLLFITLA